MDKILRPDRLELNPNTSVDGAHSNRYVHWKATFDNFLGTLGENAATDEQKYTILINYVSPDIYLHISSKTKYSDAITLLKSLFVKEKNENFARHCLAYRTQKDGESIEQYILTLETLAKECNFKKVEAIEHQEQCIRTAFIGGLKNCQIRQRLLEETKLLKDTVKSALTLEQAFVNSEQYQRGYSSHSSSVNATFESAVVNESFAAAATASDGVKQSRIKLHKIHLDPTNCMLWITGLWFNDHVNFISKFKHEICVHLSPRLDFFTSLHHLHWRSRA